MFYTTGRLQEIVRDSVDYFLYP